MADLSREQLIAAARSVSIPVEPLTVRELGGTIYVRGMSGNERDRFEEGLRIRKGKRSGQTDLRTFRAQLAAKVVVNAAGERLLNDSQEDVALIGGLPAGVLDRIIAKCTELSGKADDDVEDLGNGSASLAASGGSASSSLSD